MSTETAPSATTTILHRVLRFIVSMDVIVAAEEPGAEVLSSALRAVQWESHHGGFVARAVEHDAAPLRAALAGLDGWTEEDVTAAYVVGKTQDGARYDGFGTLELVAPDVDGWRVVAVKREHLSWQTTRYDRWEEMPARPAEVE